jgi:hypothetical protein
MFELFLQGMFSSLRSCRIRDLIVYEFRRHGRGSVADCGVKLLSYFHMFQSCRGRGARWQQEDHFPSADPHCSLL